MVTKPTISREDRNAVVVENLHLVKYCALRFIGRLPNTITYNELFSAGVVGLIDAVEKFDPSLEIPFEKYAIIRIRGSMLDEIRSHDIVPRTLRAKINKLEKTIETLEQTLGRSPEDQEVADKLGLSPEEYYQLLDETRSVSVLPYSLEDLLEQGIHPTEIIINGEEPIKLVHREELTRILGEVISTLPEREKVILSLYYYEELTMKEIGEMLGYTESRVSQLHTQILLKLKTRLRKKLSIRDLPED